MAGNLAIDIGLSIAQSAWIRKIGLNDYSESILNIIRKVHDATDGRKDRSIHVNFHSFIRKGDPEDFNQGISDLIMELIYGGYLADLSRGALLPHPLHPYGRLGQLKSAGLLKDADKLQEQVETLYEDYGKFYLLPDGRLIKGLQPDLKQKLRRYKTVPGFGPIGQEPITCLSCAKLDCQGKKRQKLFWEGKCFLILRPCSGRRIPALQFSGTESKPTARRIENKGYKYFKRAN